MGWFGRDKSIDATANLVKNTGDAFDALFTSDEERANAKAVFTKIKQRPAAWAHALNMADATSGNWFNSGWRPAIGWVGAIGLFMFFIPQYAIGAIVWGKLAIAVDWSTAGAAFPSYPVSSEGLWQLITLLLGGKVLRSVEKSEGTHAK